MKLKIGIQIAMFNKGIAVQIFEQKGVTESNSDIFISRNNFRIATASVPELNGNNTFYIRGEQVNDDWKISKKSFSSRGLQDKYLKRFLEAFQELADIETLKITKQDLGHTIILHIQ